MSDLEVVFDYYTGIISTEGMQICGLAARPLPLDKRPVSFDSIEFIPLSNGSYKVNTPLCKHTDYTFVIWFVEN